MVIHIYTLERMTASELINTPPCRFQGTDRTSRWSTWWMIAAPHQGHSRASVTFRVCDCSIAPSVSAGRPSLLHILQAQTFLVRLLTNVCYLMSF